MKSSEVLARLMVGEFLLVCELRGAKVVQTSFIDKKSGQKLSQFYIQYAVECRPWGEVQFVRINGAAPDGVTATEQLQGSLEKGKRYVFPILTLDRKNDQITAWVGKEVPLPVDAAEDDGSQHHARC